MHADRRKGRGQSRILYWFRTPPGVRIGRAALDEDAIRLIEQNNPEIEFDWTRILKGKGNESAPERRQPTPPRQIARPPLSAEGSAPPVAVQLPAPIAARPVQLSRHPVDAEPELDAPVSAAGAKLGSEGLARLRGRYAEMLARITDRVPEAERQAELKIIAERLNPDAWVTDADVLAGLDAYETTFESLRSVVGHGRRRSRRRHGPSRDASANGATNGRIESEPTE